MAWTDVEALVYFWDSSKSQSWDTFHGPAVSDVNPGAQLLILSYLEEVYNGSQTARDFLEFLVLLQEPIRIGTAANGEVAFGTHGAGHSGAINYIGIDLSKVSLTYYMNDHGYMVHDLPGLTLVHEMQHMHYGILATDPFPFSADPSVVQATENSAGYDHDGAPVRFQNHVARDMGWYDNVQSSYATGMPAYPTPPFMDLRHILLKSNHSYTNDETVSVTRFGDPLGNANRADNLDQTAAGVSNDLIMGFGGNDTLNGGAGRDFIYGGSGDDTIVGGFGNDEIWGGMDEDLGPSDGTDTVDYSGNTVGITINFSGAGPDTLVTVNNTQGGLDTLHSIEKIVGTAQADYLYFGGSIPLDYALEIDAGLGVDVVANAAGASTNIVLNIDNQGNGTLSSPGGGSIQLRNFHTQIIGSAYDDEITDDASGEKRIDGGAGDDVITITGDGAAMLRGGDGDDILTGGDGNDLIVGDSFLGFILTANTLNGGDGSDHIISTGNRDQVDGGDGHDFIEIFAFSPDRAVRGGGGNDLIDATHVGAFNLSFGADDGHDSLIWQGHGPPNPNYSNRPTIFFDDFDPSDITIIWDVTPDGRGYYNGVGNAVVIIESTGASIFIPDVYGEIRFDGDVSDPAAPNRLYIGINDPASFYQYYLPEITILRGDASAYATAAADYAAAVAATPGANDGTSGDDDLRGSRGDDDIAGGNGDDSFHSSGGEDVIDGGSGADTLYLFGARLDFIITRDTATGDLILEDRTGLEGKVTVKSVEKIYFATDNAEYSPGDLVAGFWGTPGDDALIEGDAGDNLLYGLAGNDALAGGGGADVMAGGPGNDVYHVADAGDVVIEAAGEGNDLIYTSVSYTLAAGQEVEILSTASNAGTGAIDLVGNAFGQLIYGNAGVNLLAGGGGADVLIGLGGNDTYLLAGGTEQAIEAAGGGTDVVYTAVSYALASGQQVEILSTASNAGTAAIDLTGNDFANTIYGNNGANALRGGGGSGDVLIGLGGGDTYFIVQGSEQVFEASGGGTDIVYTSVSYTLEAGSAIEYLSTTSNAGTGAIDLTGNEFANIIYGNNGANALRGGGGAGDVLIGLGGNDVYFIVQGGEQLVEGSGGGTDVVYASVSHSLAAAQEIEILSAVSNAAATAMDLTGNAFANTIYGNNGANVLNGGGGNDVLIGFSGADTFALTTALGAGNIDQIADFVSGTDRIALDDAVFTGLAPGSLPASAFATGSAAGDADDRIIYNSATGQLFFDADGNGTGSAAVLFATLQGAPAIIPSDFVVI